MSCSCVVYDRVLIKWFRVWFSCLFLVIRWFLVHKNFLNGVSILYRFFICVCIVTSIFFAVWKSQMSSCKNSLCIWIRSDFYIITIQDHGNQAFISPITSKWRGWKVKNVLLYYYRCLCKSIFYDLFGLIPHKDDLWEAAACLRALRWTLKSHWVFFFPVGLFQNIITLLIKICLFHCCIGLVYCVQFSNTVKVERRVPVSLKKYGSLSLFFCFWCIFESSITEPCKCFFYKRVSLFVYYILKDNVCATLHFIESKKWGEIFA